MTGVSDSRWEDAEVARRFLHERRRAIPLGDEQAGILLRLARRRLGVITTLAATNAARRHQLRLGPG